MNRLNPWNSHKIELSQQFRDSVGDLVRSATTEDRYWEGLRLCVENMEKGDYSQAFYLCGQIYLLGPSKFQRWALPFFQLSTALYMGMFPEIQDNAYPYIKAALMNFSLLTKHGLPAYLREGIEPIILILLEKYKEDTLKEIYSGISWE